MIQRLKNIVLDMLFPPTCLTCAHSLERKERNWSVCGACVQSIPLYDAFVCPTCTRRVHVENLCHPHAPYTLAAATHYDHEKIQKLIWQCKYEGWLGVAEPLATLFTNYLRRLPHQWKNYIIVPIPLTYTRELKRGFNQAQIFAMAAHRALYLPIIKHNLIRVKDTKAQKELSDYKAREKNMEGAFHVVNPHEFKNNNILLIDDVWTSGATLNEAARVLKASGAKKIIAAVVARAR